MFKWLTLINFVLVTQILGSPDVLCAKKHFFVPITYFLIKQGDSLTIQKYRHINNECILLVNVKTKTPIKNKINIIDNLWIENKQDIYFVRDDGFNAKMKKCDSSVYFEISNLAFITAIKENDILNINMFQIPISCFSSIRAYYLRVVSSFYQNNKNEKPEKFAADFSNLKKITWDKIELMRTRFCK